MGELKDLGTLKQGGVNALAYVRAKLAFTAVGSKTLGLRTGTAEVTDLDLVKNVVRVLVTPGSPANLTLSLGEAKTVDLDQDGIQDVRFTFASLWVNRVELTVKSIPLDPLALNPPKPGTATVAATPTPVALSDAATVCGYRFTRDLKLGMKGEDVRALQKCFTKLGISLVASKQSFNGKETDYFGMATKTALASFQRTYHLPALGYLGSMTRTLLNAPLSKSYYASKPQ
jgi:peptidoglycan hydrolase-like protein with peptidoglycan-binding domain